MTIASFSPQDRRAILPLFQGCTHLHGMIEAVASGWHGQVFADHPLQPRCAVLTAGDALLCGGTPGPMGAHLLRQALASEKRDWLMDAPGPWAEVLSGLLPVKPVERFAFEPAVQPEDTALQALLAQAPQGVSFQPIHEAQYSECRQEAWSRDFVAEFPTPADYAAHGLGVLLLLDSEAVAGASSYLGYPGGLEIQVQTKDGLEGHGFATLAAAKLIRMAHELGRIATWDAANAASAHIAEKLGYAAVGSYQVYMKE